MIKFKKSAGKALEGRLNLQVTLSRDGFNLRADKGPSMGCLLATFDLKELVRRARVYYHDDVEIDEAVLAEAVVSLKAGRFWEWEWLGTVTHSLYEEARCFCLWLLKAPWRYRRQPIVP